jgi:hypothetical protein
MKQLQKTQSDCAYLQTGIANPVAFRKSGRFRSSSFQRLFSDKPLQDRLLSHNHSMLEKVLWSWKETDLEILINLCVFSPPDYGKVFFGMPSVCMYELMCASLAPERFHGFY